MSYCMIDEVLVRSEGRQSAIAVAVPCDDTRCPTGVSKGLEAGSLLGYPVVIVPHRSGTAVAHYGTRPSLTCTLRLVLLSTPA